MTDCHRSDPQAQNDQAAPEHGRSTLRRCDANEQNRQVC